MIRKTQKIFKRLAKSNAGGGSISSGHWRDAQHFEIVVRNTWWLLWVVPLYLRETIVAHDLTL